jgi:Flp pilus assembly protein TadG
MVLPLFLLMMFGFVEIALISASIASYNFAAKDAARLGALVGPTDNTADQDMFNLIKARVAGVVVANLVEVEIYHSDAAGDPPASSSPIENAYDANFNPLTSTWPVSSRNDTLLDADYLGVRITYQYTYLTSYLSGGTNTLTLTANSVQRIEPQDFQSRVTPPVSPVSPVSPVWLVNVRLPRAGEGAGSSIATLGGTGSIASVAFAPEADMRRQTQAQEQVQMQVRMWAWAWGGAA